MAKHLTPRSIKAQKESGKATPGEYRIFNMKPEKLAEIKARLAKPTPEPFKTWLEELVEAVEGKTRPDPVQKLAESVQKRRRQPESLDDYKASLIRDAAESQG